MLNTTTIRRSPIVLIRNFAAIEILAFVIYYFATGHGNAKYEIYSRLFFSSLVPYDMAKFLLLSGAQLVITIYAFLSWYYEYYQINQGIISHSTGVFFKRKKTFALEKNMNVMVSSGPVGKLFHYGTINLEKHQHSSISLKTISRPQTYLKIIEKAVNPTIHAFAEKPDINKIIQQDENERLEFKSSLRFDHKTQQLNRDLEKTAMKTIAAFLNSKGGYLVIGFDDSRQPLGIHHDYQTFQRKDSDGFENHFTQVFNSMIGPEFRHLVKVWFYQFDRTQIDPESHRGANLEGQKIDGSASLTINPEQGRRIETSLVQTLPSPKPVYLKTNDSEHFYIRTGNIVSDLKFSEVEDYVRSRWPRY